MLLIMPSEMTHESTGSAIPFTSTGSFAGSLLPGRSTGDCVERDTCTTRHDLPAGQPGRGTPPSPSVATVESGHILPFMSRCYFWVMSGSFFLLRREGLPKTQVFPWGLVLHHEISSAFYRLGIKNLKWAKGDHGVAASLVIVDELFTGALRHIMFSLVVLSLNLYWNCLFVWLFEFSFQFCLANHIFLHMLERWT